MADGTNDYYDRPGTLVCEHCRAVWRITDDLNDDTAAWYFDMYDQHVCDPDVDLKTVEEVRDVARRLAVDLGPDRYGHLSLLEMDLDGPEWAETVARHRQCAALGWELALGFGFDLATLTAAAPFCGARERERWEEVAHDAMVAARRLMEPLGPM